MLSELNLLEEVSSKNPKALVPIITEKFNKRNDQHQTQFAIKFKPRDLKKVEEKFRERIFPSFIHVTSLIAIIGNHSKVMASPQDICASTSPTGTNVSTFRLI